MRGDYKGMITHTDETFDSATGNGRLVTLAIDFTATPYVPARVYGDPNDCYEAEGGEVDIGTISLDEVEYCEDHSTVRTLADLSEQEKAALIAEYEGRLSTDATFRAEVHERCCEEASSGNEYCGD
jgi:hypothetical protein